MIDPFDPYLLDRPEVVKVCPVCGHIVLRWTFADGTSSVQDPGHSDRRMILSFVGAELVGRFGFAPGCAGVARVHLCPGPPDPPLKAFELYVLLGVRGRVGWDGGRL